MNYKGLPHIVFAGVALVSGVILVILGQETIGASMISSAIAYTLGIAQDKKI